MPWLGRTDGPALVRDAGDTVGAVAVELAPGPGDGEVAGEPAAVVASTAGEAEVCGPGEADSLAPGEADAVSPAELAAVSFGK